MSWNVHGSARPNRNGLAEAIRSFSPDIVAVQEVQIGQAHRLANRLGWNVLWTRKHFPLGPLFWWRAEGLAVISRLRITARDTWLLTPDAGQSTFRRRVAQRVIAHPETDPTSPAVHIINAHLASHDTGRDARVEQATLLASLIEQSGASGESDRHLLLVGDLNADDEPAVLEPLRRLGLTDAWESAPERATTSGLTSPSHLPRARIDYVLTGPGWGVRRVEVPDSGPEWTALSDHLPVVVDVVRP